MNFNLNLLKRKNGTKTNAKEKKNMNLEGFWFISWISKELEVDFF